MAEVTKELIYEFLQRVDQQICELSQGFSEVRSELSSIGGHMIATEDDLKNICGVLNRQDASLERIERRLDPNQTAVQRP
ncbi:hypothetical protein RFM26_03455 [Mesorhizobium sp. VK23B]|uniref:Uncharacterized protein n=1 Tax=Mesorhizobium dulcispinae TaxID=3072316 RepID=A0ABU4X971_9HYPH|nr:MULTISPECIES: hypothetical protein [unclassified Mesorhizobium]MDX8464738.1 hypothetical protein [Mesorhizobium sp. VK23B]MDX8471124.1 hypothetical protein [Mesorhizobium sp. VK23A]